MLKELLEIKKEMEPVIHEAFVKNYLMMLKNILSVEYSKFYSKIGF